MSKITDPNLEPYSGDTSPVTLRKILQRLNDPNVTDAQDVSVINTPSVNAAITNGDAVLPKDAFYRVRVSQPNTIVDLKQVLDNGNILFDDQETSGGGTGSSYDIDRASTILSTTALTTGAYRILNDLNTQVV